MPESPKLIITRGLPASGKTTKAKDWVAEDPTRRARVNRDDTRDMLHGRRLGTPEQEIQVTKVRNAAVSSLLDRGISVVCDDMTLQQRYARDLRRLAELHNAELEVWDLTDVPVDVCIERDLVRSRTVGAYVIRDLHARFIAGKSYPLPFPEDPKETSEALKPYVPVCGTPRIAMVDIDGTVALMAGRSPYDETRVHEDLPNLRVIEAVLMFKEAGLGIMFLSGRSSACMKETRQWISDNVGLDVFALIMRPEGDKRKDSIVKYELFNKYIRNDFDVRFVLDDRNQVVDMWRSIGLTVFQVADGNF